MAISNGSAEALLPDVARCIDCDAESAVPAFVWTPKGANFAKRLPGRWIGKPPRFEDAYAVYQCRDCGSAFLLPAYFAEADACYQTRRYFEGYYPDNIHIGGHPNDEEHKFPKLKTKMEAGRARWLVRLAQRYSNGFPSIPRMCDIGCASGWLVFGALTEGYDAYGVEISPQAIRAKQRCGEERIHHGPFDEKVFGGAKFDLVVLMETAEHIQDLGALLRSIRKVLTAEGVLVIVSPNDLAGYRHLVWRRPWWLIPPIHVRFFSPQSLSRLLEQSDLRLLGVETLGTFGGDLFMVLDWVARRLRIGLPSSGVPFKVLRQAFEKAFRPLDWVICRTVGHSELVVVAGPARRAGVADTVPEDAR
ncbi:MAG: hypothetical protein AMXMBFR61_00070 [Fimbriimonadales bacterium]